ncbi:MFS transporter [Streptomyces sp. B8F3]|uniref:MFS transporter n=1 Tax=Streptomyces sp. B8F3 TaxID=3153573 RepID=UPI00325EC310
MRSYTELFRTREFTPFFLAFAARTAAQTISALALATLVYRATDSPLLAAISMFGPHLAQVLGATFLMSGADRLPPRSTLTGMEIAFAVSAAVIALPGLPVWVIFPVLFIQGLVASVGGGVRGGLLHGILTKNGYLLGRSVFTMSSSIMQILGFTTGGALLTFLSPRACLFLAAGLYGVSALLTRLGLTARPPRASGRLSVAATWRTNKLLLSSGPRRLTYLGLWVPNGLIIGCESLYVSYSPDAAGTLFASSALGMLVGNLVVGRLIPPMRRSRLATPLLLLLATPYLSFALRPGLFWSALAAGVASVGFGATLVQIERLMSLTPEEIAGHTLGLHSSGMLTMQGVSAALAGTMAQFASPAVAMATLAATSISVTVALAVARKRQNRRSDAAGDGERVPSGVTETEEGAREAGE